MLRFVNIDVNKHKELVKGFRRDSFLASFGDASGFEEEDYIEWLKERTAEDQAGFVLLEEDGRYIGQLELTTRDYEGRKIGYVNLYYLVPEKRGSGKGHILQKYAEKYFRERNLVEYHLRVSPANKAAIQFYRKNGMEVIGPEVGGKVLRMKGYI